MNGAMLLPEFDQEMANARRMLEGVADDKLDFRPHEKSWTMRELAAHVANIPTWTAVTMTTDELDLNQEWETPPSENREAILAHFDESVAGARETLEGLSAETMGEMWTLKTGDEVHFSLPKGAVFRSFVMNHLIHHRAQLGVYLRMCDIPVPGMYGPTADEAM